MKSFEDYISEQSGNKAEVLKKAIERMREMEKNAPPRPEANCSTKAFTKSAREKMRDNGYLSRADKE